MPMIGTTDLDVSPLCLGVAASDYAAPQLADWLPAAELTLSAQELQRLSLAPGVRLAR